MLNYIKLLCATRFEFLKSEKVVCCWRLNTSHQRTTSREKYHKIMIVILIMVVMMVASTTIIALQPKK